MHIQISTDKVKPEPENKKKKDLKDKLNGATSVAKLKEVMNDFIDEVIHN